MSAPTNAPAPAGQPKARTFTRISVVSTNGHIDIAAPDDMSVPELLRTLVVGLGEDVGAPWVLEHPTRGVIRAPETLGSFGVLDGEVLNLRPDVDGPLPVAVDDVADAVGAQVAERRWRPEVARPFGTVMLMIWLVALELATIVARGSDESVVTAVFGALLAALAVTLARIFGGALQARIAGVGLGVAAGVVGLAIGLRVPWPPLLTAFAVALGVGLGLAAARLIAPDSAVAVRPTAMILATLAETLLLLAVVGLWVKGPAHLLAIVLVAMLAVLGTATEQSLIMSGLVALDQQAAAGKLVTESTVHDRLDIAHRDLFGLLLATSVTLALLASGLALTGGLPGLILAALALLIVLTRARTYVAPAHVMALTIPALVIVLAAACIAVGVINQLLLGAGLMLLGGVVTGLAAFHTARPVEASRFRRFLDWVETIAIIAVVPVVLWLFNAYAAALHHFK